MNLCGAGRVSPEAAPNKAEYIDIEFNQGDIIALNGENLSPAEILTELNRIGGKHGIGRLDLVENRYVGMKSRGCYETPWWIYHVTRTSCNRIYYP